MRSLSGGQVQFVAGTRDCAVQVVTDPFSKDDEQKAVAREMQKNDWDFVPHVWLGQFLSPVAYRKNLRGVLAIPEIIPFWNMEKT